MHAAPTRCPRCDGHEHSEIPRSGCARMRRAAVAAFRPARRSGRSPLTLRRNPQSIACRMIMTARGLASPGRGAVVARPLSCRTVLSLSCQPSWSACRPAAAYNHTCMCIPARQMKRGHHRGPGHCIRMGTANCHVAAQRPVFFARVRVKPGVTREAVAPSGIDRDDRPVRCDGHRRTRRRRRRARFRSAGSPRWRWKLYRPRPIAASATGPWSTPRSAEVRPCRGDARRTMCTAPIPAAPRWQAARITSANPATSHGASAVTPPALPAARPWSPLRATSSTRKWSARW